MHGGETVEVAAPIDTLPLFVKAGSIVPMGVPVGSTRDVQTLAEVRVYPGADATFTLYNDDGVSYDYEKGAKKVTELKWDEAAGKFSSSGAKAWDGADSGLVRVVGR